MSDSEAGMEVNAVAVESISAKLAEVTALAEQLDSALCGSDIPGTGSTTLASPNINRILDGTAATTPEEWYSSINKASGGVKNSSTNGNGGISTEDSSKSEEEFVTASECTCTPPSRSSSFHTASEGEAASPWWEQDIGSETEDQPKQAVAITSTSQHHDDEDDPGVTNIVIQEEVTQTHHLKLSHNTDYSSIPSPTPQRMKQELYPVERLRNQPSPVVLQQSETDSNESSQNVKRAPDETSEPLLESIKESRDWLELKVLELTPALTLLGATLHEASDLQRAHHDVLLKIQSKQSPVEELLRQADQLIADQKPRAEVYAAMADSLALAWRDVNSQLQRRKEILDYNVNYHSNASVCLERMRALELACRGAPLPIEVSAIKELLSRLNDVRRAMLESLMAALQDGRALLDILQEVAQEGTLDSRPDQIRTAANCAVSQVEHWLESLHDRRRLLEVSFQERKTQLEQCLALALLTMDLQGLENILEEKKESLNCSRDQLGDSDASSQLLLHEHRKLTPEAKELQEQGLKILKATEQLAATGHFAGEDAIAQAYQLLNSATEYIEAIDQRDQLLNKAISFFRAAHTALTKLDQLDVQLSTTELPRASPQLVSLHSSISRNIEEATDGALQEGYALLEEVPGAESIKRKVEEIENHKLQLNVKCVTNSEESIRASKALNNFLEKQNHLYSWLVSTAEAFIQGHQDMGSVLAMAKDFLQLHYKLLNELQTKGTEINALLSSLPSTLELLDDDSRSDVNRKAEELQKHWSGLKRILERRSELARTYVKFHSLAVDLANEMDELDDALHSTSKNENIMKQLEQKWVTAQQLHMQLINSGNNFIQDSNEVGDPYLDVERARLCVSTLTEHFTARKNTLASRWNDWEAVVTQNRHTTLLWERNMADTNKTVDWISRLDAQLYPVLNEESSSAKLITSDLELKLATVLPEVKRAQSEIQLRIQTAEDLIGKGEIANRDDTVIIRLKELQQKLQTIITEYQILLEMLISFFKNLTELERTVEGLETEYGSTQLKTNLEEVEKLLKEHDASRQAIMELFKFTLAESQQIINKIKQQEPETSRERDIWTVKRIMEEKRSAWERAWTERRLMLEQLQQLCQFDTDLSQIHDNIDQLEQRLVAVRGQYGESLASAKSTSLAFLYFEKTIELLEQRIETFVTAAEAMLSVDTSRAPHIKSEVKRLRNRWDEFHKQVSESRRLIDLSIQFFTLVEEAEEWFREGSRLLVTIARKSSLVRTPQDATELLNELEIFLKPGEAKQDERIEKITQLAEQLFGIDGGPAQIVQVKAENREMKDSFSQVTRELKTLAENLQLQQQQQQEQRQLQQEKMEVEHADKGVNVTSTVTEIIERSTLHEFLKETKETHHKSPSPPPKKAKYKEESQLLAEQTSIPPSFVIPLVENAIIDEGNKFTFECRVTGIPVPEISWLKDGISIQNNPDYQTRFNDGLCSVTIEETFAEDSAIFTCRAHNIAGISETSCRLSVKECEPEEQFMGPNFTQPLIPLTTCEGAPCTLTCKVEGNPLPTVQWFKDDICIDNNPDYSITYNNGDAVLQIEQATLADQAEYSCRAANKIGTDSSSAKLTVKPKEPLEGPKFVVPLSNVMARAGQKIKLECEISGEPTPQITWLFNGKQVKDTRDLKILYENGKAVLIISEAFPKDAGTYSVRAVNMAGEVTGSCQVSVKGRLPTETSDSELASDMEPIKPSVQLQLKDTAVFEGMKVRLDCVIVGQPEPEVIWFHEDKPVKESADFQLLFHGDRCSLIIHEAYLEDAGEYKVVAINSAGEASSKCRLTVQSVGGSESATRQSSTTVIKEVIEINKFSPKFTQLLTDVLVPIGESTTLQCSVEGSPTPSVSWLHNNQPIEQSDRIKWDQTDDGVCTLKILNVINEDKGNYVCRAHNELGESKCFAHLIVKGTIDQLDEDQTVRHDDQKTQPSFTELFSDCVVREGEPAKFECIVNGKPTPKVRWLFNDAPVSGKDFLVSTSGPRQVLSIPATSKNNVGTITCVAENEAGKASCVAKIKISDAPIDLLLPSLENINLSETPGGFEMKRAVFTQSTTSRQEVFSSSSSSSTTVIGGSGEPHVQVQSVTSRSELASQKIGDEPPVQVEHHKTTEYQYQDGVETQQKTEMKTKSVGDEKQSSTTSTGTVVPVKQRKQIPPRFITPVMGRIVDQGVDVTLEGIIESFPQATVKWTKNGQEVIEKKGVSISWELNRARLLINNVTVNDAGKYTCTATNSAGTASCTADIVVKKSIFPPVMGRRLQGGTAVVGERVTMEIEVTGTPDPEVTWYKDGQIIPKSSSMYSIRQHGNSHSLLIEKATLSHSGQYSAKAVNSGGEARCIADFIVMEPPAKPQVIEVVRDIVVESITKDSEEKKTVKPSTFIIPPSQQLSDTAKKEKDKFEQSVFITETMKTDKQVSIKVSHSSAASSTDKTEFSKFQEEKKSSVTPVPIIESPIPYQRPSYHIETTTKPEIEEVKQDIKKEESVQISETSDITEETESHLSKRDALDFFKNIIKVNKEEQEKLPKKRESIQEKPIITSPLPFQQSVFDSPSTKEYFQSEESVVSGYKKEYCEIVDGDKIFNLEPGSPPEMGFVSKTTVATKKEDMLDRVKKLEESRRTLSDEEVPSGAVRIFPVQPSKKEDTASILKPLSSPRTPEFLKKFETVQEPERKKSIVEELIIPQKVKPPVGLDEKTYKPVQAPVYTQSESKLSPVYRPQADIALRPQSPRPSAEAVSMEKLWSGRPKESDELTQIIKSEDSKRNESSFSKIETKESSWDYKQTSSISSKPEFESFNGTHNLPLQVERPVSPLPSAEGVAMDRMWAHKHSESSLKTVWPPPAPSTEVRQKAPWLEDKSVNIPQPKPEVQTSIKKGEESFKKEEFVESKQKCDEKISYSSSQFQSFDSQKSAFVVNKPLIKHVSPPRSNFEIPSAVETPKIIYVAEAHATHKVNLPQTQTEILESFKSSKSEYSETIQTSKDESILEESILKPSEAKKLWPPGPKPDNATIPFPKKVIPPPKKEQAPRPISAQEFHFEDFHLEPGPPPEIGFAEPPKSERRQSHVEIIEQDLEKDLEKEPSRQLVGAVRIIPPPKKEKSVEQSISTTQQTFSTQTKKTELKRSHSLHKDSKPLEPFPQLEPFPFKPEPPRPKPKIGIVPKPSKFTKHSFTESDYESDFESSKIPARWTPYESDSEEPSYRKVKPPSSKTLPKRPHSVSCDVIPPTQFEQPSPLQGPVRPSSCVIPEKKQKEIKTKTFSSVEEVKSKNTVVKQFQSSSVEKTSSVIPGPPPVGTEQPLSPKPDVDKHKPDSPKSKQKVTKPVIQRESGYMADTDEPRRGVLKQPKTSSEQSTSVAYSTSSFSSSSSSSSFVKQHSFQQKQVHSSSSSNKVPASIKTATKKDVVSHQIVSFPPPKPEELTLEPFPFKTEPTRPAKRSVGPPPPSPSKFVKGEFRESDYESDYEGRIPVMWRPHESDTEDVSFRPVHPVLSSPLSHKSKQTAHSPTPPTVFESPPQVTGSTRPKFTPIEKPKSSKIKIKETAEQSVVKPKAVPAQKSPPIEKIVATPALGFNLKPGSPPKMDYAPPPPHFSRIPGGTQMETSNTVSFAEATENSRRVVNVQQMTRVIKFDESKTKKTNTRYTSSQNKSQESDYESDYDSLKIKKTHQPLPSQQSSQIEYQTAEQKRLQRVEEMRKRFSAVEPAAVEPVLTPGETPQFGFTEPKIPAAAANIANRHMTEMTQSFKSKAQRFASDVISDVKSVPKQNGVSTEKSLASKDDPQAYREESRLSEYGTKHIDPDTGLIYFKYDFGYEFGVVLPGEGGKTTKSIKKQIESKSKKEEGSIEVPVIHETTGKSHSTLTDDKKLSSSVKSVKWEQTSESEMSDIDGDNSRRRHQQNLPQPLPQQKEPHIYIPHTPSPQSLSPSVHSLHSLSPYLTPGIDSTASPGSSVGPASGFSPAGLGGSVPSNTTPPVVNASKTPEHSRKAPIFITPLRDIAVINGQSARFECIVQAEPLPNILWAKDGRILQPSDQHNIQFRNGVCRLTMPHAMPYDAGKYTCTATNLLGTTESSASLQVSGERRSLL
ncbi:zormin isoform X2 [Lycorma delicatula]|uniref:zormin isoform X2 n=1 Tax=Lycorma delicatula TaxID=130591 RepID=UPI003F511A87